MSEIGQDIIAGLQEALAHAKGETVESKKLVRLTSSIKKFTVWIDKLEEGTELPDEYHSPLGIFEFTSVTGTSSNPDHEPIEIGFVYTRIA